MHSRQQDWQYNLTYQAGVYLTIPLGEQSPPPPETFYCPNQALLTPIAHHNVECSTEAYNGTFAKMGLVCYPP